jgi:uncharacterized protein YxjI
MLEDNKYKLIQSAIRNKYKLLDSKGNEVFKGKQKMFKMKEAFPITDPEGNKLFKIKAEGILDIAGNYTMYDSDNNKIAVFDKKFTLVSDEIVIRDPNTEEVIAKIKSENKIACLLRSYSAIASLILPRSYNILNKDGEQIGFSEGQRSIKDKYEIELDDNIGSQKKMAIVVGLLVLDSLDEE